LSVHASTWLYGCCVSGCQYLCTKNRRMPNNVPSRPQYVHNTAKLPNMPCHQALQQRTMPRDVQCN
jgi:hypothetical protein